ncbi:peptidylprolyl isomerase [Hufsiella ginkgonis]|uniref:peptidylprolyl isomerase n=1 Tax=Hufsiella ginkgonis TaxID=2695274 RepID=A0A7K1XZB0_9SPHI|nr:peptidylprolyl isomerase [Hufsiella ginkgonis]MXV16282.1 peptidylprolyl isomerase [Hufsiella ginkgonis]
MFNTKIFLILTGFYLFSFSGAADSGQKSKDAYVLAETTHGNMVIRLYKETPRHRDNFVKLARSGYFNRFDMNRVVKNFVIQGGETDSAYAAQEKAKGPDAFPRLMPELDTLLFHKKGAFAAGRDDNPGKTSFTGQYYFVQGRVCTDSELDRIEHRKGKNFHFSARQREVYKTVGGTPALDQDYTVFGEVISGIGVIDKLAAVKTGPADRPVERLNVKFRVLSDKEITKLLKN